MKKLIKILVLGLFFTTALPTIAHAKIGDMGFMGGIIDGRKLPKTTETIIKEEKEKKASNKTSTKDEFIYKEIAIATGKPVAIDGNLTVKQKGDVETDKTSGTYEITYEVVPLAGNDDAASITRIMKFDINWRKEGKQVIKDYKLKDWSETIGGGGEEGSEFELDNTQSNINISIIEDHTPGVVYYKGNISYKAVYVGGEEAPAAGEGAPAAGEEPVAEKKTTVQTSGTIYGYQSAWSSTETHRLDTYVYADGMQVQYQIRPSVSVTKELQYSENEPTAISFAGNYRELIQNQSAVAYTIFAKPAVFFDVPDEGSFNIDSFNEFEQLIAPDTNFLKGHFAEADISKLFSMQVLEGKPSFYIPNQAMTRGQYVQALSKAIKLPITPIETKKKTKKNDTVKIVFPDVLPDRAEYPYIMAAYDAGLAIGRDNGNFFIDATIQREEAIVILIRALGLEQLGLDTTPMTPFTDDAQISSWAKKEVYAAQVLGIISGDVDGKFRPHDNITKAEGAALVNRLITYMRKDLVTDYTEHIINYAY